MPVENRRPPATAVRLQPGGAVGRLTLVEPAPRVNGNRRWRVICECGTEAIVWASGLAPSGRTRSCGCLQRELLAERARELGAASRQHGHTANGRTTPTYRSWRAMWRRCTSQVDVGYAYYGARGITVCDRWRSFEAFLVDMGERPEGRTLDRIDSDGHYEPGNCRWATPAEQTRNRSPRS